LVDSFSIFFTLYFSFHLPSVPSVENRADKSTLTKILTIYWVSGLAKRVLITDGHPDCVLNQLTCIQMNEQHSDSQRETATGILNSTKFNESSVSYGKNIRTALLRWSVGDTTGDLRKIKDEKFDIVIAADCLFFKDFHDDFLYVLTHSLRPGGLCFLLQPRRGGTMDLFLEKIKCSPDFEVICITEDYSQQVKIRN
jgi:predicted nicotinamide N-methyase